MFPALVCCQMLSATKRSREDNEPWTKLEQRVMVQGPAWVRERRGMRLMTPTEEEVIFLLIRDGYALTALGEAYECVDKKTEDCNAFSVFTFLKKGSEVNVVSTVSKNLGALCDSAAMGTAVPEEGELEGVKVKKRNQTILIKGPCFIRQFTGVDLLTEVQENGIQWLFKCRDLLSNFSTAYETVKQSEEGFRVMVFFVVEKIAAKVYVHATRTSIPSFLVCKPYITKSRATQTEVS